MAPVFCVALAVCLVVCSGAGLDHTSCFDAAQGPHIAMTACTAQEPPLSIQCETNNSVLHFAVVHEIPSKDVADGSTSDITFCIGLLSFESSMGLISWGAEFDSRMAIGVLVVNRMCWLENRRLAACGIYIRALSSILALPLVGDSPNLEQFWASRWPRGWVRALHVSQASVSGEWLGYLANSGIQSLSMFSSIEDYGSWTLDSMPVLKRLSIVRTGLMSFHPDNFLAAPNLEDLDLSRNVLSGIPPGISGLKSLKRLDISQNMGSVFRIPTHELSKLTALEELNFSKIFIFKETMLKEIPYLPNLKVLNLSQCRLNSLGEEEDPFKKFPALQVLDLSRNNLNTLGPRFMAYRHLSSLLLNRNNLDEWPMLYKCTIDYLDLSWNKLSFMKNLGMYSTLIVYLNLSKNEIIPWDREDIFTVPVISSILPFSNGEGTHMELEGLNVLSQSSTMINDAGKPLPCSSCNFSSTKDSSKSSSTRTPLMKNNIDIKTLKCPNCKAEKIFYIISENSDLNKNASTIDNDSICIDCKAFRTEPVKKDETFRSTMETSSVADNSDEICSNCNIANTRPVVRSDEWHDSWVQHVNLAINNIHAVSPAMSQSFAALRSVDLEGNPFDCSDCSTPQFAQWAQVENRVNDSEWLLCEAPFTDVGRSLLDASSYKVPCLSPNSVVSVLAGSVGGTLLILLICGSCLLYWYRFELAYIMHLFRLRHERTIDHYNKYLYDAFVCYSGNDRPWVMRTLAPLLEGGPERYQLCLHDRDFTLGSMIVENIVHSIECSRRTVIVLSRDFISSKWCQWELDMANHRAFEDSRNFLILFQLEHLNRQQLPRHLKLLMDSRTYLEWPQFKGSERAEKIIFRRLRDALGPSIHQMTKDSENIILDVECQPHYSNHEMVKRGGNAIIHI